MELHTFIAVNLALTQFSLQLHDIIMVGPRIITGGVEDLEMRLTEYPYLG